MKGVDDTPHPAQCRGSWLNLSTDQVSLASRVTAMTWRSQVGQSLQKECGPKRGGLKRAIKGCWNVELIPNLQTQSSRHPTLPMSRGMPDHITDIFGPLNMAYLHTSHSFIPGGEGIGFVRGCQRAPPCPEEDP